jgi:hypothetical protein
MVSDAALFIHHVERRMKKGGEYGTFEEDYLFIS